MMSRISIDSIGHMVTIKIKYNFDLLWCFYRARKNCDQMEVLVHDVLHNSKQNIKCNWIVVWKLSNARVDYIKYLILFEIV